MENKYLNKITVLQDTQVFVIKRISLYQGCFLLPYTQNKDLNLKHYINRRGLIKTSRNVLLLIEFLLQLPLQSNVNETPVQSGWVWGIEIAIYFLT